MSEKKRFEFYSDDYLVGIIDTVTGKKLNHFATIDLLNEQQEMIDQLEKENKRLRECLDEADDIITSHLSDISITYWRNYCKTLGVDL